MGINVKWIISIMHRISKPWWVTVISFHIYPHVELKLFSFCNEIFSFLNLIKIPEEGDVYSQMKNIFFSNANELNSIKWRKKFYLSSLIQGNYNGKSLLRLQFYFPLGYIKVLFLYMEIFFNNWLFLIKMSSLKYILNYCFLNSFK